MQHNKPSDREPQKTMEDIITTIQESGVATITLNRPARHNAFDELIIRSLQHALEALNTNPQVRVVVLRAAGKSFSAGADLVWMKRMAGFSEEENFRDALQMATCFHSLATMSKPTIAVVQGPAYGGGVGLIAACDIAVAAREATFCFSEVKLGLIPAVISPYVNQAMGKRTAQRYYLTAETFSADKARHFGLVHSVVPKSQLTEKTEYFCRKLLRNGPEAMAAVKARLATYLDPAQENTATDTARWIAAIRATEEGKEGIAAFLDKRAPSWINHY